MAEPSVDHKKSDLKTVVEKPSILAKSLGNREANIGKHASVKISTKIETLGDDVAAKTSKHSGGATNAKSSTGSNLSGNISTKPSSSSKQSGGTVSIKTSVATSNKLPSKQSIGSKHSAAGSKQSTTGSKHSAAETKPSTSGSKHSAYESERTIQESYHSAKEPHESKHSHHESKHSHHESKHSHHESKHSHHESKHSHHESKHSHHESKHSHHESKHSHHESKHSHHESKHSHHESKCEKSLEEEVHLEKKYVPLRTVCPMPADSPSEEKRKHVKREQIVKPQISEKVSTAKKLQEIPADNEIVQLDIDYDFNFDNEGDEFVDELLPGSLMVPIPHFELDEYKLKEIDQNALFPEVITQGTDDVTHVEKKDDEPSILVTGFGMRNLKSLQDALAIEEQKLMELYKRDQAITKESEKSSTTTTSSSTKTSSTTTSTTIESGIGPEAQLEYLMGIQHQEPEEYIPEERYIEPEKDEFEYSPSMSMKKAQRYLRAHRIFDFFQFIIAHLLSAAPDNPIEFILELLNKCLLYRAGAGKPPTLYDSKHFAQLFYLMDRMNCGFIDLEQYKQGMKTFGICEYNPNPIIGTEGITKETFIEEVEEAQIAMFDDLIRRKIVDRKPKPHELSPVNYNVPVKDAKSTYFMPDDLFKSYKKEKEKMEQIKEEVEMNEG